LGRKLIYNVFIEKKYQKLKDIFKEKISSKKILMKMGTNTLVPTLNYNKSDTRLIDKIFIEKDKLEDRYKNNWINFLEGNKNTILENIYQEVKVVLKEDRWVVMQDDLLYDNNIKACWLGLINKDLEYKKFASGVDKDIVLEYIRDNYKIKEGLDLPTKEELYESLTRLTVAPFALSYQRPTKTGDFILYKKDNLAQGFDTYHSYFKDINDDSIALPIFRITRENDFYISNRELFFRWIVLGLIPDKLKDNKSYIKLIDDFEYKIEDFFKIKEIKINKSFILSSDDFIAKLLNEDKIRADISEYNEKMLYDTNQGHWELWGEAKNFKNPIEIQLKDKLVARDPKSSIVNGTIGIDFGTKSTVVVYQKDNTKIYPMRIGTGNLKKIIASTHYENPTIMEFNNLDTFIKDYQAKDGRPSTKWQDLTISHTAFNSLMNSSSSEFNSFVSELKQWAGDKNKKLKVVDKNRFILDLPPFMEVKDEINPIELYAYYLGLYINNQRNGIFLNYILSFPVTYEIEIRDKIIDSFYKGIKKSLPQELHNQSEELAKLSVIKGASEPSAYAIIALEEYKFEPINDERVFYGVFDFGGGTTDFDFGVYREANGKKERRYDYIIEHFGAGGDRYLGGENLLELLAFEIFKKNKDNLLKQDIQFILPPECNDFLGSETILSISQEAKMNTKTLMEKLRPFWEGVEGEVVNFEDGIIEVNLTNIDGKQIANFSLDIDIEDMKIILYKRIEKGVKNFFNSLRVAFANYNVELDKIKTINIFLSGNSSKSIFVHKIFKEEIEKEETTPQKIFKIFEPLGNSEDDMEKPTAKTGVAFGLIKSRKGGKILVIDHNIKKNINFKFYLGEERRGRFKVVVDRDIEYNEWIDFIDASEDTFELFYSSQSSVSTNKISIDDNAIKKIILKIDIVDDDALVYIRTVSPTEFEFVVALENEIENERYLGKVQKIILKQ